VLVNAVYFKGAWDTAFDPSKTGLQPFTLSDGTMVNVPTMSGMVNLRGGIAGGPANTTLVYELGYKGGAYAMDFLLPSGQLSAFESSLTPSVLNAALDSLGAPSQDQLLLPKFAFTTRLVLTPVLAGMGMPDLFDGAKANLSGMDGRMDLFVHVVVQQALIHVDEEGTIAASATAAGAQPGVAPTPVVIDQPFLFLIRDTKSGSILFMGRVEDPRQGS
ncbi:MAG: serpin family protein, partial [Polyangiaceae bacterium]